ncbi:MAG: carbohydrate ABC transporter permease [Chloroflexi bacterium]|nr:MAG: carbohydrate ABC transporter permease [Chloroflexota bacterium]
MILFVLFLLFPFFWMILTSVRPEPDFLRMSREPFNVSGITFNHYIFLLTETKFLRWLWNSFFVATIASTIAIVIGLLAAYSLGKLRYKGGGLAALVVFITYLVPPALLFIPLSSVVNTLGLSNSLWALILTYLTFMIPFIAWMLSSYFKGLPKELSDAARIDGASRIQAMVMIDLPLVLPGIISVFFFAFTLSWQEYLYALTFLRTESKFPIALGVVSVLQVGDIFVWGPMMAGAVLGSVPVVIIYTFLMDYYLAGLTAGAVKG